MIPIISYVIPDNELIFEYFWSGDINYYLLFREHWKNVDYKKTLLCASKSIKIRFWEIQISNIFGGGTPQWGVCRGKQAPTPGPLFACLQSSYFPPLQNPGPAWRHIITPKLGVFSKASPFQLTFLRNADSKFSVVTSQVTIIQSSQPTPPQIMEFNKCRSVHNTQLWIYTNTSCWNRSR